VLDNVGDPDQVVPLLPHGTNAHRMVITSRDSMARLPGARLLDLHILDTDAAVHLLRTSLRRRGPTDRRITDDLGAAARLVELCGRLPLAVQIVAALLADEPDRPLTGMVADLTDERRRLYALDYDGRWAVRAAFELSHRRLHPATAELFALLAAIPGPDVGLTVAAAVADRDLTATRAGLRALCRAHLLDQQPTPPGHEHEQPGQSGKGPRWRMHDLIRLYAAEHLTPDQHNAGFTRVLAHYQHTAYLADRRFTALPADQDQVPVGFATPQEATAWVVQERAGLVAAIVRAAATHPQNAAKLASDLAPILVRARLLTDWVIVSSTAVQVADALDRWSAADAWNCYGQALQAVRRFDEAITAQELARDISREVEDREGEGIAWTNLGNALRAVRRFDEAITAHEQAGDISREAGDRHREGTTWHNLGDTLGEVWRFDEAITAHERARDIFREAGDRHREAGTWDSLGFSLGEALRFNEAITAHERAVELYREVKDRHSEAGAWDNLGFVLQAVGRFDEAITAYEQSIAIRADLDDQYRQAQTLAKLGIVHVKRDDTDQAQRVWVEAIDFFTAVGEVPPLARRPTIMADRS
jgi:tetratricopeptide (TPR) repeat protein